MSSEVRKEKHRTMARSIHGTVRNKKDAFEAD